MAVVWIYMRTHILLMNTTGVVKKAQEEEAESHYGGYSLEPLKERVHSAG